MTPSQRIECAYQTDEHLDRDLLTRFTGRDRDSKNAVNNLGAAWRDIRHRLQLTYPHLNNLWN